MYIHTYIMAAELPLLLPLFSFPYSDFVFHRRRQRECRS